MDEDNVAIKEISIVENTYTVNLVEEDVKEINTENQKEESSENPGMINYILNIYIFLTRLP